MIEGADLSCQATGFVFAHAQACEKVANRFNCIIMFREPGLSAQRLISEGYAMKGFRIDTKSCTWGPMRGFVCMDPRLSKPKSDGGSYQAANEKFTREALLPGMDGRAHLGSSFVAPSDPAELAAWIGDVMPIVISQARIDELVRDRQIEFRRDRDGSLVGSSSMDFRDGRVVLPWRLVPVGNAKSPWLVGAGSKESKENKQGYHVLCVDTSQPVAFKQLYPSGVQPIRFRGYETVLGLTNPGTKERGFYACVTADYDLFAILPSKKDIVGAKHAAMGLIANRNSGQSEVARFLPGGVPRLPNADDRLRTTKTSPTSPFEHYKHGDVSGRIMTIKVMLNGQIMAAGYKGGNAVHHNDEAGNEFLAKANLAECLPVIAFLPKGLGPTTVTIQTIADFKLFYDRYIRDAFVYRGKKSWAIMAGIDLTEADRISAF